MFHVLADIVILVHFVWVAFLILGFPVVLFFNKATWRIVHLGAMVAAAVMQVAGISCPLTLLEAFLKARGAAGARHYPGDFIPRVLENWIYVDDAVLNFIRYAAVLYAGLVVLSFYIRPLKLRRHAPIKHGKART